MINNLIHFTGTTALVFGLFLTADQVLGGTGRHSAFRRHLLHSIAFGTMAMGTLVYGREIEPGVIIDARGTVIALSVVAGGPWVGGATCVIAGLTRLLLGGAGMWAGLAGIGLDYLVSLAVVGLWRKNTDGWQGNLAMLLLISLGVGGVEATSLLWIGTPEQGHELLQKAGKELFITQLVCTVTMGALIHLQRERSRSLILLEGALSTSMDGFALFGEDGQVREVNRALETLTGYSRAELLRMNVTQLEKGALAIRPKSWIAEVRSRGQLRMETQWSRRNGTEIDLEVSASAAPESVGGVYAFLNEITQRKAAERRNHLQETRLLVALDAAGMVTWDLDVATGRLSYSSNLPSLPGAQPMEPYLSLKAFMEQVHTEDLPRARTAIQRTLELGVPFECDYRIRLSTGAWHWLLGKGKCVHDDAGKPSQVLGASVDITALKQAEKRSKLLRDLGLQLAGAADLDESLRLCLRTAIDIAETDSGSIHLVDPQTEDLRLACHAGLGSTLVAGLARIPTDSPDVRRIYPDRICHGNLDSLKFPASAAERHEGLRALSLLPIHHEDSLIAVLNVSSHSVDEIPRACRDSLETVAGLIGGVLQRLRAQDALKQAQDDLARREVERARDLARSEAKSRFLAHMSHEIRTPMNAILGFAQLMQRDPALTECQSRHLATINNSGEHLLRLINDVLDMSRIEAGKLRLIPGDFDFRGLIADMESMFRLKCEEKGLHFEATCSDSVPARLHSDGGKVRQVLLNLLSNAVKFTHAGGIRLHVTSEAEPESSTTPSSSRSVAFRMRIELSDTGVGIAPEEIDRVFDAFEQTQAGMRHAAGTGLGMAISRQLTRMLGGDLSVTSQPGVGSRFQFTFVAQAAQSDPPKPHPIRVNPRVIRLEPTVAPPRILVADDIASNREVLRELLEQAGFVVVESSTGCEAVRRAGREKLDVVLLDRHLPDMDGLTATRAIRMMPAGEETGILVISADVLDTSEAAWKAAGADGFIAKPFHHDELLDRIGRMLNLTYVNLAPAPRDESKSPSSPEALPTLPTPLREALVLATESGDIALLRDLIAQRISPTHPETGRRLLEFADRYDYAAILKQLETRGS